MSMFVGVDLVHIPAFAEQLERPGSTFESVFSARELRVANIRFAGRDARLRAEHLAGRWAAKEAFIKAWSQGLFGRPPVMDEQDVDWSAIEVVADRWGRVAYDIAPALGAEVVQSLGQFTTALSISHDGDYASATCIMTLLH